MAAIIYDRFGGIIPKVDPRLLPPANATRAHNVELSGGKLAPINMSGGFQVSHDPDTGIMTPQIPEGELISIPTPDAPVVAERIRLNYPEQWSWLVAGNCFVEYFDASGVYNVDSVGFNSFSLQGVEYTEDGFLLKVYLGKADVTLQAGIYYKVYGPKFGFKITVGTPGYLGGPESTVTYPNPLTLYHTSPIVPQVSIPLKAPVDYTGWSGDPTDAYAGTYYTYGKLELIDVNAPVAIQEWNGVNATSNTLVDLTQAGECTFYFRCNYERSKQVFVRYTTQGEDYRIATGNPNQTYSPGSPATIAVQSLQVGTSTIPNTGQLILRNGDSEVSTISYSSYSLVSEIYTFTVSGGTLGYTYDSTATVQVMGAETGREGPASDESELIVVDPGEVLKLTTPRPAGCTKFRIYRNGGTRFQLLEDEVEADVYYDTFTRGLGAELPPYGSFPHASVELAEAGSLFLGGRIGVLIYGDELRPSEPDQPWVYPEEYAFPLYATILAGVGFLSSAIIWTDTGPNGEIGKVYRVGGQHPAYWTRQLLTNCKPLLNVRSVAQIDQTAFYVSNDGVIAIGGGGQVQNLTEQYFNREEWVAYSPQYYSCYIRDESLFLIHLAPAPNTGTHFRIDLNDGSARLTTFDGFNSGDLEWIGRIEKSPRPVSFRAIQVHADGYPVELTLTGDTGAAKTSILLPDDTAKTLPRMRRCKEWQVGVKGRSTIDRIAVAGSVQELLR